MTTSRRLRWNVGPNIRSCRNHDSLADLSGLAISGIQLRVVGNDNLLNLEPLPAMTNLSAGLLVRSNRRLSRVTLPDDRATEIVDVPETATGLAAVPTPRPGVRPDRR